MSFYRKSKRSEYREEYQLKKDVLNEKRRELYSKNHKGVRDKTLVRGREWKQENPEYRSTYYALNRAIEREFNRKYLTKNPEVSKIKAIRFRQRNPFYFKNYRIKNKAHAAHLRQTRRLRQDSTRLTPEQAQAIEDFYDACSPGFQVDHIVPINHPDVCGLHMPWNLQYLPSVLNSQKGNSFDGTYENESWKKKSRYCHQYIIKMTKEQSDITFLREQNIDPSSLKVQDFEVRMVNPSDQPMLRLCRQFILDYEYLGTIPQMVTNTFALTLGSVLGSVLAGVIMLTIPNAYGDYLIDQGDDKDLERLIARGACASYVPKNMPSAFVSRVINLMVANTNTRIFSGYADPLALELGTIYQACNFLYLGQHFGSPTHFRSPKTGNRWRNARWFRKLGQLKKWSHELGYTWNEHWNNKTTIIWSNMPAELPDIIKKHARKVREECETRDLAPKHKYIKIKGINRRETKSLLQRMKVPILPYPKNRGEFP